MASSMIDERRSGRYERIYDQLKQLIEAQSPTLTAAMATICAVLHHKMPHHFWTGFYFVASQEQLNVGPYQGPVACQVLTGRGVCLHCARTRQPVIVPDVEQFPGHIACDARSKSEIALPVTRCSASGEGKEVIAVLDIDAAEPGQFDEDDVPPLDKILTLLQPYL